MWGLAVRGDGLFGFVSDGVVFAHHFVPVGEAVRLVTDGFSSNISLTSSGYCRGLAVRRELPLEVVVEVVATVDNLVPLGEGVGLTAKMLTHERV